MPRCPSCANEIPPEARFCPSCGVALTTQAPAVSERRVVSILFDDLVGCTTRSDRADPEDVRRTLIPFHAALQRILQAFGGTLDKFIGDAVMGVFGAPIAHEDDPIRAVGAGLAILDAMADLRRDDPELSVRVAVNTGEAIVTAGAGPRIGEAVAGDVNAASRMESLAPVASLVIGPTTRGAIGERFRVEQLPPATVKGKADPLVLWRVLGERETPAADTGPALFVGRRRAALAEAAGDRSTAGLLYREVSTAWQGCGVPWEEALALQGVGRCADDDTEVLGANARSAAILQRLGVPGTRGSSG